MREGKFDGSRILDQSTSFGIENPLDGRRRVQLMIRQDLGHRPNQLFGCKGFGEKLLTF